MLQSHRSPHLLRGQTAGGRAGEPGARAGLTNKIFVDYLDRYKFAAYSYSQKQEAFTFENKVVADTVGDVTAFECLRGRVATAIRIVIVKRAEWLKSPELTLLAKL